MARPSRRVPQADNHPPPASPPRPPANRRLRRRREISPMCPVWYLLFFGFALANVTFFFLCAWKLSSIPATGGKRPGSDVADGGGGIERRGRPFGSPVRFVPSDRMRSLVEQGGLDKLRLERRSGLRPPRLALVAGSVTKDSKHLMILTVVKSLVDLGYNFEVFIIENGKDHVLWEHIGCKVSTLLSENSPVINWSNYEGVILISLEGKRVVSRLLVEPFVSVPLIWLIQEDTLGKRLLQYDDMGWQDLIDDWKSALSRADVVVFADFSLPILYTLLDTGNYFVIPGYPVNIWASESYITSHSRIQLRKDYGFVEDELVILVLGSYFFYDELPWDYVSVLRALARWIAKASKVTDLSWTIKFILLCGESTDKYAHTMQAIAARMGFPDGSLRLYGLDHDVNKFLLMADIVLFGSLKEEQTFPPLLLQAMSFELPIVAPNLTVIRKHVIDGMHGFIFNSSEPESLARIFSILIEDNELSLLAYYVASQGRLLSMNMLAADCVASYAKLLENILEFPSDIILPDSVSQIQQSTWLWDLFDKGVGDRHSSEKNEGLLCSNSSKECLRIVYLLEKDFAERYMEKSSHISNETSVEDFPIQSDWDDIDEVKASEEFERQEEEELDGRMDRTSGSWEEVYRNARKAEKHKNELKERDEAELERTGQPFCIYEIYSGQGAWPFLHNGSMYRGITLSERALRSGTDDVNAVSRLPLLNNTYYRDLLCELGAMFAVAKKVDNIHKFPWIGFQSWRTAGEKVSLSINAAKILEATTEGTNQGDVVYFWAVMEMGENADTSTNVDFWYMCDLLNAAQCRPVFEDAFRRMYGLPHVMEALPPMPSDGDNWSILHSWVMPTRSFLKFVMFSRMFVDSLDSLNRNNSSVSCLLGSSKLEKRHCYCRVLELLVNVWAYHSARRMVYLNPLSGELKEQHPLELRKMWVKYFDFNLLKKMDEDLAEDADEQLHLSDRWLWPLTGEVIWQGILDRESEERYRLKMDKMRRIKERLSERHKHGYKQQPLAQKGK